MVPLLENNPIGIWMPQVQVKNGRQEETHCPCGQHLGLKDPPKVGDIENVKTFPAIREYLTRSM